MFQGPVSVSGESEHDIFIRCHEIHILQNNILSVPEY